MPIIFSVGDPVKSNSGLYEKKICHGFGLLSVGNLGQIVKKIFALIYFSFR